ncbi:Spore coat protein SA [Calycomorphotria hydatis]|uniref:Spore coat protein SA n=2 Tax=Calycomorphotria hydatis TaxID=2528027 RepID=A0A517TBX6_9PLAN|nr:Spore coat protein SA [Calycomorphotria hydatis]
MFCGSCMHDNTWARALHAAGEKVTLLPLYTPIRVDEENISSKRVFFGGLNLYFDYRSKFWSKLPRRMTRWLDNPALIKFVSSFGISNDAHELGNLTLATLAGIEGPQRKEIEQLVDYLADELRPDVIVFSNALLAGAVPELRKRFSGTLACVLQGDDIFLEELPEQFREQAIAKISQHSAGFDRFITHSTYYADFMANYLRLPREKFVTMPLGIDFAGHDGLPKPEQGSPFTVGYFARICPAKGFHEVLRAFKILHERHPDTRLVAGGYLHPHDQNYFRKLQTEYAHLGESFTYAGSPDSLAEKTALLKSFDVLSVPTVYREPKGLFVLEALANGIPVVQPHHGAFPELLEATGGGLLYEPGNAEGLANRWEELIVTPTRRHELAQTGHTNARQHYSPDAMVNATREIFG